MYRNENVRKTADLLNIVQVDDSNRHLVSPLMSSEQKRVDTKRTRFKWGSCEPGPPDLPPNPLFYFWLMIESVYENETIGLSC